MSKLLRIDMSAKNGPTAHEVSMGEYAGLGGRALTSAIVANEVTPLCYPLGPDNKLVIAPGLLSGTTAAMSGRISVGCKSPLTGGIKEANAGGQPSQTIAKMGYAAIVLEGKPVDPHTLYKIHISKHGVKIIPDNSLKMLGNYDLIDKMKKEYGNTISCISIGPAGEMKMSAASVAFSDMDLRPTRHAARGGVGAVMGSKGVKVIILDDQGFSIKRPANPEKFKQANKVFVSGLKKHPVTGEGLPAYGTNMLTNLINEAGAYPTRNFTTGRFETCSKISGETLVEIEAKRGGSVTQGCHRGCVIRCSGVYNDNNGNFLTKQPEYETVGIHGGNCGIDNLDAIAMLDRLDDDIGVDTIEMGAAIGVAMEAGIAEFGDADAAVNLVREVGKGTPLGRILGNGAAVTGKVFGVERVPVVKNQSMPAYDPRSVVGQGVTYATSPMGADHTAGYAVISNLLGIGGHVDPLKAEGQIELSRNLQIATAAIDSTGMCLFVAFAMLDQPETFQAFLDLISGFTGEVMTSEGMILLGKSVLKNEREFNKKAGFSSRDDRLPDYFKKEKLGPHNTRFEISDKKLDEVFNW
jgi:aldehyde:ferredoxin oxidoreductase